MEKDRASPSRESASYSPLDAEYDAERVREYVREYVCESGSRASRGAYGARAATRLGGVAGVRGVCANVPRDARADAGTATASFGGVAIRGARPAAASVTTPPAATRRFLRLE